ncbi:MAG: hypothetical protein RL758_589, partial [Pseudomonadota bacterium]
SNDVPEVVSSASNALGTVTEAGNTDDGSAFAGISTATGQIVAADPDQAAVLVYEIEGSSSTLYGALRLNRDTGEWVYTLDNTLTATQNLREGQQVVESYTVKVTDDRGAVTRQTVQVTIVGSNDVPVVVDTLAESSYTQGQPVQVATAQLFTDIDLNAGDFTYSATLPPGLSINASTGEISGAGTQPGDFVVTVRATDAQGAWAETTWNVRINAPARSSSEMPSSTTRPGSDWGASSNTSSPNIGGTSGASGSGSFSVLSGGVSGFGSTIPTPGTSPSSLITAGASTAGTASTGTTSTGTGSTDGSSATGSGSATGTTSSGTGSTTTASGTGNASTGTTPSNNVPVADQGGRTDTRVGADGQLAQTTTSDAASQSNAESTARSLERVNVTVGANGQVKLQQQAPQGNESPTGIMLVEVQQQQGGLQIEMADFRRAQVVQYRATLPDGSPLPAWIKVDASTGKVTAEPGQQAQLIEFRFIAQDANGSVRTLEVKVDLSALRSQAPADPQVPAEPVAARPAFMQQLAAHQQQWHGYGKELLSSLIE